MEMTMQFCFTIIVASFIAVAAMASQEPSRKREPKTYVYIVKGTEYQSKLEALKAALNSSESTVMKCESKGLASFIKK